MRWLAYKGGSCHNAYRVGDGGEGASNTGVIPYWGIALVV